IYLSIVNVIFGQILSLHLAQVGPVLMSTFRSLSGEGRTFNETGSAVALPPHHWRFGITLNSFKRSIAGRSKRDTPCAGSGFRAAARPRLAWESAARCLSARLTGATAP